MLLSKEMVAVFDEAAKMKREAEPFPDPPPVGANAPMKKRKKDGGQPYRDTIGIGNVGRKGGDQRGGVMVKTVDLCNYIYAAGGWEGVRRWGLALVSWLLCCMHLSHSHSNHRYQAVACCVVSLSFCIACPAGSTAL
jgi:hypothetical protein